MEPLAKPSGITLAAHRQHVYDEARSLLEAWPFLAEKYARLISGGDLVRRVRRAAWYHDEGKCHDTWQQACRKDYALYQEWRSGQGLDPNAVDPDEYRRYERAMRKAKRSTGPHLFKSGLRHEFASLTRCEAAGIELDLSERAAIAAHHGKLGVRHEKRWRGDRDGEFRSTWTALKVAGDPVGGYEGSATDGLIARYETAGVRSLLRLADTRASRREAGGALPVIEPFSYAFNEDWTMRPVQRLALAHADDPVSILRAPTGSGKTDAAFLWGRHQIEHRRADRLVVAMPTRFTSNALALGSAEKVSETGLYHSSAWHARFGDLDRGTPEHDLARERHKLARLLATPLTVCTIDHLLIALTGTHEDQHATFFFLANSAVVFDEVDFYDPFVQANLVLLLGALRTLRVPVLLMSATVPESARSLYRIETDIRQTEESESGRRVLHRHPPVETPAQAAEVLARMIAAETGIVYANTVERAVRYFDWLTEEADNPAGVPIYLYHSRFTEPDKKRVEEAIIGALGLDAWRGRRARGIVILTQIGEMSVNISAPLMLTDLCPWDRLAQRLGRLARFAALIPEGQAFVADPHREGELYPAPYGTFQQGAGWLAAEPLLETARRLDALTENPEGSWTVTAPELVAEVNALYPHVSEPDADAARNVTELQRMIRENWLIVQANPANEDDATVPGRWKSRDIPPQKTVLVRQPEDTPTDGPYRFDSYDDMRSYFLDFGVECASYLIERGWKRGALTSFSFIVGEDRTQEPEQIFVVCKGYDPPDGLGRGKGLGSLARREHEDAFSAVSL